MSQLHHRFSPAALSPLVNLRSDDLRSLYQDLPAPGTTPVTAPADPIRVYRNLGSGGDYEAGQSTRQGQADLISRDPTILGAPSVGRSIFDNAPVPGVVFKGPDLAFAVGTPQTIAINYRRLRPNMAVNNTVAIYRAAGPVWSALEFLNVGGYQPLSWRFGFSAAGASVGLPASLVATMARCALVITYNGGSSTSTASYRAWLNGVEVTSSIVASGSFSKTANETTSLAARWNSGTNVGSLNGPLAIYDHLFLASDASAYAEHLTGYLRRNWVARSVVGCAGDSLTYGSGASNFSKAWTSYVQYALGLNRVDMLNCGLQSQTMATVASQNVPMGCKILCILLGTNDIASNTLLVNGGSVATWWANLTAYIAAQRALNPNLIVIVSTLLPRLDANSDAAGRTRLADANTFLLANYASGGIDIVVNSAANAKLSNPANTTYYNVDELHLNDTGYGVLGTECFQPAISLVAA